jgi:hypothetical protein
MACRANIGKTIIGNGSETGHVHETTDCETADRQVGQKTAAAFSHRRP